MGPGEIKELHRKLATEVSRVTGTQSRIHLIGQPDWNWERARPRKEFAFELDATDPVAREQASHHRGNQRVAVLALDSRQPTEGGCLWVAWYEKWRKSVGSGFCALTASWAVFQGLRGDRDKTQLFCAHWDQLRTRTGSSSAGQPHWHFDRPIMPSVARPNAAAGSALREFPSLQPDGLATVQPAETPLTVGHVHLAMGTWRPGLPNPECWQREARKWPNIAEWAIKTIEYIQSQFART